MERDFDSESNFEERLIEDEERNDKRFFTNQLLLSIQGLGSIQEIETEAGSVKTYLKGANAEASLKQLCLQCRKDIPDKPTARLYLYQYKVLQNDLIKLLTGYPQDKVLSYYVMILLESMTNPEHSGIRIQNTTSQIMLSILQEYKLCFIQSIVLETIIHHFSSCLEISYDNRSKTHNQMIELIVLLFRNLLLIPDAEEATQSTGSEIQRNLQRNFIHALLRDQVIAGLNYISQDFKPPAIQKLAMPLMEIFYQIYTPFDPQWLLRDEQEDKVHLVKSLQKVYEQKRQRISTIPPRHSRFAGLFITKRTFSTSGQISSVPFHTHQVNKLANQRLKPMIRALVAKQKTIFPKNLTLNIFDNDSEKYLKDELRMFTIDFQQHNFSRLIECCYNELNKDIVDTDDKVHYFVLLAYFLQFTRYYAQKNSKLHVKQQELSTQYAPASAAISLTQFQLIYSNLIHESTQLRKRNFNYRNFFAVINALLELILIVKELSLSTQQIDRKNSQILMQQIFTHDISKALNVGYSYCQYGLFKDMLLEKIIQLTSVFYDLLESYSQGKTLSIRTNKLLKKKIQKQKKKQQQEHNEENENEQEQNEEEEDESQQSSSEDDEPIYKERRFNFISEFAIVVDYTVIEKYFYLIKDEQLLRNSSELNISIYKYFKRIVDVLKADWMFFQLDFMYIINSILQNKQISYKSEFTNLLQLFRRITMSFIQLLKVNKLLVVEILFRYPDVATKDSILKNYAEITLDQTDEPYAQNVVQQQVVWTQLEDKTLIENYEKYKDFDKPEEQLSLVLNSLGFSMKSPLDIKRRIKKFRLNEGTKAAVDKYHHLYEKISMRKEEIMAKNVKELLVEVGEEQIYNFFKQIFEQLIKYIEYRGSELIEMPVPPVTKHQFEYFEKSSIQAILLGLDFKPPQQGEIYWRLQTFMFQSHVEEMQQTLTKYLERAKLIQDDQIMEDYRPLQMEEKYEKDIDEYLEQREEQDNFNDEDNEDNKDNKDNESNQQQQQQQEQQAQQQQQEYKQQEQLENYDEIFD